MPYLRGPEANNYSEKVHGDGFDRQLIHQLFQKEQGVKI